MTLNMVFMDQRGTTFHDDPCQGDTSEMGVVFRYTQTLICVKWRLYFGVISISKGYELVLPSRQLTYPTLGKGKSS